MTVPIAGRGFEMLGVYGMFVALSTLTVALRVYCRTVLATQQRAFGWDDILGVIAWACFICFTTFSMTGVHHGTGQHYWNIKPETEIPVAVKFWWLCESFYVVSNMAIKASIAVMLLRLVISPAHRMVVWTTLIVTQVFSAGFLFFFLFQCWPSNYFYTRYTGGEGRCVDTAITVIMFYIYSGIICIADWVFAILPCIIVWNLQMPRTQKLLVSGILAMGAIASAATIIRIPYIEDMRNEADFLHATVDVAIWSCCETGLAIVAGNCATLRPLFRTMFSNGAFNKSTSDARPAKHGYARSASPGPNHAKVYTGPETFNRSIRVHGLNNGHDRGNTTELDNIPKGRIRVEQCDSASIESATPSNCSTTQIVK